MTSIRHRGQWIVVLTAVIVMLTGASLVVGTRASQQARSNRAAIELIEEALRNQTLLRVDFIRTSGHSCTLKLTLDDGDVSIVPATPETLCG